jgi:hypothetical protein
MIMETDPVIRFVGSQLVKVRDGLTAASTA